MKPTECSCERCRAMCAESTCLPTPDEARALIRAGHAQRLAVYVFPDGPPQYVGPAPNGKEGRTLPSTREGACTFFDGKDCELHAAGLKPLEGRLAHHDRRWLPIRLHMDTHWRGKRFESVVSALDNALRIP